MRAFSSRGGTGTGAAPVRSRGRLGAAVTVVALGAAIAGCGSAAEPTAALPSDFPRGVPITGTVLSAEKVNVGHPVWRVKVRGDNTAAAARALTDAGLKPVTDSTPMDVGKLGSVYRGAGVTVGLSSYDGEITYVIDPA